MNKKTALIALILLIFAQLCAPAYMIANKYYTLKNGVEIKFSVRPVDPYDPFRGRYVSIRPEVFRENSINRNRQYGIIEIDEDGYAGVTDTQDEKPAEGVLFVKSKSRSYFSIPIDRYYMDEKLAPKAERATFGSNLEDEIYVTARILNGNLVVSGLYINDIPIEEYIKTSDDY